MKVDPDCNHVFTCRHCGQFICSNCERNSFVFSACNSCRATRDPKKRSFRPKPNCIFQKLMDYGLAGFTLSEQWKLFDSKIIERTPKHVLSYYEQVADPKTFNFYQIRTDLENIFEESFTLNKRTGPRKAHSVVFGPSKK